ncbi:MAG TPA: YitT family protein [Pseudobacteroides sp.]|uniref:YitT family protein n=1 Tax=Pseudobacteroides sp. TaxID=1968840 RepID=UPI002F9309DB
MKKIFSGIKTNAFWKNSLLIVLGSLITAVSISVFMVPYKIAPGGVSGIATVIYYLTSQKFPVGAIMLVLNIPLFVFGFKFIGRKFIVRTFFSTILLSVFIDFLEPYTRYFVDNYLVKVEPTPSVPDLFLYSIFGGFLMGLGLGMVFKAGATTGGSDLAARIANHFIANLTMGQLIMIIDTAIIICATIAFNSFHLGMYAIITLYISSKVIDAVLEGVNFAKSVLIISDKSDEIAARIMDVMDRGVTALRGIGMYTGKDKNVLLCIVHRGQLQQLKEIIMELDSNSFIILTDIREVLGEGFKTYDGN